MQIKIPFAGQVSNEEQAEWLHAINAVAKQFTLVPLSTISAASRKQTEVAVVANPDPDTFNELPQLKWIQSLWAGVEGLLGAKLNPDIAVVRLADPQMAQTMAEAVLAWTLFLHRKMPQYTQQQSDGIWHQLTLTTPQQCNVSVFGLGKLGSAAAQRLRQNNFTVRGWSSSKKSIHGVETFHGAGGFDEILQHTNIAVILLPMTSNTRALFNTQSLSKLPVDASIINFARGPIIVESDLLASLNSNHIKHAVLDVFDHEPLPADHPFWQHPSVTVLPHISAPTTVSTAATIASHNIDQYLCHGTIPQAIDRKRGY